MRLAPLCVLLWSSQVAAHTIAKEEDAASRQLSEVFQNIAGYAPGSDVTEHNAIDLDQAAMETELATPDFDAASAVYMNGGNSVSKGAFRTLQGFSTGAQGKMYDACP